MKKYQTYDQLEATKDKAARFARDVLEDDDLADDLEDESPESYAERKHVTITNAGRRITTVAGNGNGSNGSMTKDEMADCLDQIEDILTDAYTPEASREDLAAAIGDALDIIEGGPAEDDTGGGDVDDDDSGN